MPKLCQEIQPYARDTQISEKADGDDQEDKFKRWIEYILRSA
jgi:hypothetical protein